MFCAISAARVGTFRVSDEGTDRRFGWLGWGLEIELIGRL